MPSIKDRSTVEAIAAEYCSNGRCKERALKKIGYKPSYYKSGRSVQVVYGSERIKQAIAKIDAENAEIGNRTVKSLDKMYQTAYALGEKCNQPAAMNGSVTGIARLYGMDKDADHKLDEPKPLSVKELDKLRAMAQQITDDKLESKHHKIGVA